jgi:MFS family permease
MGGEYGGAAVYIAEHAPNDRRGLYTSFIQVTATAGLALSLAAVLLTRNFIGDEAFGVWGWRIPFIFSLLLLFISLWIRLSLQESPIFQQMIADGRRSKRPLMDALTAPKNFRLMLVALFGLSAGMTVVWYTSQFYVLFFLDRILKVDAGLATGLVAVALVIASPFFVLFGWLSDKIGRKPIIISGCLIAAATLVPLFQGLTAAANPRLFAATQSSPVIVTAERRSCTFQFDPIGRSTFRGSCDLITTHLTRAGVSYRIVNGPPGNVAEVQIGQTRIQGFEGANLSQPAFDDSKRDLAQALDMALKNAGYPQRAASSEVNLPVVLGILVLLVIMATMCYGPLAAALAEMFATQVRYSSVSISYNIAVGWIGGFLPAAAFAMVAATGDIYFGLWYPIFFAAVSGLIGLVFVRESHGSALTTA